jgi:hypothetical protein
MAERVRISLLSAMRIAVTGLLLTEYLISREIQFGKRAQCASQCCTRGPRARPTLVMAARDSLSFIAKTRQFYSNDSYFSYLHLL